jgi:mRNA interferase MazF
MKQYEIFYVNLDPTVGHEMKKSRPCLIVSPDEMNQSLGTVIVAPITSAKRDIPTRVYIEKKGTDLKEDNNWAVLDQIRTIDKSRLGRSLKVISESNAEKVASVLCDMFKQ